MMKFNQKTLGFFLVGISIILIIVLGFIKVDIDSQAAFLCESVNMDPDLTMEQCPAHQSSVSWLLILAFGAAALILAGGIYMILIPVKKVDAKKADLSKLDDEEKKIYELLKQNDGSMYQSDLIKETGFSKVKITRILDKMTGKHVIDRQRRGMTNIVILK